MSDLNDVNFVKCDCCCLSEECTRCYITTIREMYGGKWICGLCAEAVKDEVLRCGNPDEAMARHLTFCTNFRASGPPQVRLIRAMTQLLRKSSKSMPSSPRDATVLTRSESCLPSLTLDDASP
ncbi:hypothetical protein SASPL_123264 [Salvia splendens]|uniref:Uncharacterized protein n=1 Tax=Salvia splendens TaxID=180675 RepID=A0A8X8XK17_SALSN|nr:hypothetical protein SASPL_123264 [Salvia splendens]